MKYLLDYAKLLICLSFILTIYNPVLAQENTGCQECSECEAQNNVEEYRYSAQDTIIFHKIMKEILPFKDIPMSDLVIKTAKLFIGTPYTAGTLEKDPERLTINMRETDCILLVEMCLSMAITAKSNNADFKTYCETVKKLRYCNGIIENYASRNHYTSAWIIEADKNGILKDISKDLGGTKLQQKFYFMSSHPESYRQLKENPSLIPLIRKTEEFLSAQQYWYLPKNRLSELEKGIKDGDIICFNTSTSGIDIAHVGYAYRQNGVLNFIHASYNDKKVEINPIPLIPYTNAIKSHNGLRILRLEDK